MVLVVVVVAEIVVTMIRVAVTGMVTTLYSVVVAVTG